MSSEYRLHKRSTFVDSTIDMVERSFTYKTAKLNYARHGMGQHVLFLFHGFGQDHTAFNAIITALDDRFTTYSFDLFFHGKSEWSEDDKPISKAFWKSMLEAFCVENNIDKFSLAGFSIGCRLVLACAEAIPQRTKQVFLLAPDGIKNNIWFTLATYLLVLRKLFKSMILKPDRFMKLANILYKYKIVDRSLFNVAMYQMNTEEKRKRVYYSWVAFRHLKFNLKKLGDVFNKYNIGVTIAIGKHDKIIKVVHLKSFLKHLKDGRVEIIDNGHTWFLRNEAVIKLFASEK